MSFCTVLSAAVQGLSVEMIRVEADVSNGLPMFHMVGYLSSEVKEASEECVQQFAIRGMKLPAKKIIGIWLRQQLEKEERRLICRLHWRFWRQ